MRPSTGSGRTDLMLKSLEFFRPCSKHAKEFSEACGTYLSIQTIPKVATTFATQGTLSSATCRHTAPFANRLSILLFLLISPAIENPSPGGAENSFSAACYVSQSRETNNRRFSILGKKPAVLLEMPWSSVGTELASFSFGCEWNLTQEKCRMLNRTTVEYLLKRQRKRIVQECRTIAALGASPDPQSTSYARVEKLLEFGLSVHPIMPGCQRYLGVKCYDNLALVPGPIDITLVFPDDKADLDDVARQARDKGVGAFWIDEGELSAQMKAVLAQAKIQVIEHENLTVDYSRHFPFLAGPTKPVQVERKVTVGKLMTRRPVTIKRTDRITDALDRMKAGHFRHLPVVDEDGRLIGILSDRDLRLLHLSVAFPSAADAQKEIEATSVEQAAFFDPITISPDETLEHAMETMLRWNVGALPVVRTGDKLAGIITYTDLMRELVARDGSVTLTDADK